MTTTTATTDPAQSWMDAFRALWTDVAPEVLHAAREYIPLMASPEEAVRDLGGPVAQTAATVEEHNCTCGAPDSAHCPRCWFCPGKGHEDMCGW